jgi:hypothetical protein
VAAQELYKQEVEMKYRFKLVLCAVTDPSTSWPKETALFHWAGPEFVIPHPRAGQEAAVVARTGHLVDEVLNFSALTEK